MMAVLGSEQYYPKEGLKYFDFHTGIEEKKMRPGYRSFYTIRNLIVLMIEKFSKIGIKKKFASYNKR